MIGDNIKQIRLENKLTQQKFAERLGISQSTVATIEGNKGAPSDQLIISICREFNINREWLETGEGEMHKPQANLSLEQMLSEMNLTDDEILAIKSFLELPPEYRKGVIEWGKQFAKNIAAQMGIELTTPVKQPQKPDSEKTKEEAMADVGVEWEAKKSAEKRGTSTSSASTTTSGLSSKKMTNSS